MAVALAHKANLLASACVLHETWQANLANISRWFPCVWSRYVYPMLPYFKWCLFYIWAVDDIFVMSRGFPWFGQGTADERYTTSIKALSEQLDCVTL